MTRNQKTQHRETFEELDRQAHDTSDLRPMSPKMRREWELAKQTGRQAPASKTHKRKQRELTSQIVPIMLDTRLLDELDRFAKDAGVTRSGLIAEAIRLRMAV